MASPNVGNEQFGAAAPLPPTVPVESADVGMYKFLVVGMRHEVGRLKEGQVGQPPHYVTLYTLDFIDDQHGYKANEYRVPTEHAQAFAQGGAWRGPGQYEAKCDVVKFGMQTSFRIVGMPRMSGVLDAADFWRWGPKAASASSSGSDDSGGSGSSGRRSRST